MHLPSGGDTNISEIPGLLDDATSTASYDTDFEDSLRSFGERLEHITKGSEK